MVHWIWIWYIMKLNYDNNTYTHCWSIVYYFQVDASNSFASNLIWSQINSNSAIIQKDRVNGVLVTYQKWIGYTMKLNYDDNTYLHWWSILYFVRVDAPNSFTWNFIWSSIISNTAIIHKIEAMGHWWMNDTSKMNWIYNEAKIW